MRTKFAALRVPLMFCVFETLQPAICVCASAVRGVANHANRVQTIKKERVRSMKRAMPEAGSYRRISRSGPIKKMEPAATTGIR